ncbi:MAG: Gfo/Idh/MocA family oxidoreductase [Candidatus Acidiferrales bacterium]
MKILIVGCGSIGRRHARSLHDLGASDLLLVDPNKERADALAHELNARSFEVAERAYDEEPEAALICAPTSLHLKLASQALEKNRHLFVEKPLSGSMEGVQEFVEAVELQRRALLVGYNFRFDAVVKQVQAWISEGKIGCIIHARFHFGSYLPWRHPWEDYRRGYGARRELGGGVILDAIHELDMAVWFFGLPETVYCVGGKYSDLEIEVEDTAEIVLSYPDKVVSVHLDYVQRPAERWCEIIGTHGRIRADVFARSAMYFDGGRRTWEQSESPDTVEGSYKREMKHWLDCVEGRAMPVVDGKIAAQSLLLAEEVKASMRCGQPVSLRAAVIGACAG